MMKSSRLSILLLVLIVGMLAVLVDSFFYPRGASERPVVAEPKERMASPEDRPVAGDTESVAHASPTQEEPGGDDFNPVAHEASGLEQLQAAGFKPGAEQQLGRFREPTGGLDIPRMKSGPGAMLLLASVDRDEVFKRVQVVEGLLGAKNAQQLYSICQFEDLRATEANKSRCERRFREAQWSVSREQSEESRREKDEICSDLGGLRGRLGTFVDVARAQVGEKPELVSDMLLMAWGAGLIEMFCRSR